MAAPWTVVLYLVASRVRLSCSSRLVTIAVFSFNEPEGRFNTKWNEFTLEHWKNPFPASDYTEAFKESIRVGVVACILATALGGLVALAIARYRMRGGALINLLLVLPLTTPEIVMGSSLFTLFFNQGVDARLLDDRARPHDVLPLASSPSRSRRGSGGSTGRSRTRRPISDRHRCGRS